MIWSMFSKNRQVQSARTAASIADDWFAKNKILNETIRISSYAEPELVSSAGATVVVGIGSNKARERVGFVVEVHPSKGVLHGMILSPMVASHHASAAREARSTRQSLFHVLRGAQVGSSSGPRDDPPELPFNPSMPDITNATPERAFQDNDLVAFLIRNVKSIGETRGLPSVFEFPNVFAVMNAKTGMPVLMITYEVSTVMGTSALCAFTPDGHSNFGRNERLLDPNAFVYRAKQLAEEHLEVTFSEVALK